MSEKIILVQILDGEELLPYGVRAFTDRKEAESYFIHILREDFGLSDDDIDPCLRGGFYVDETHFSVVINDVDLTRN